MDRIARFAFEYAVKYNRKKVTAVHKANIMYIFLKLYFYSIIFSLISLLRKIGDGLFLEVCKNMASKYPNIQFDNMIIDNASMQVSKFKASFLIMFFTKYLLISLKLVSNPHQFDVMLMPNLYGNILSNIGCGIVGGPGLMSGINVGDKYAVFETVHFRFWVNIKCKFYFSNIFEGSRNTGTSIAGKDIANPMAFLRAGVDMLYYLG